jgi:FdhD protein
MKMNPTFSPILSQFLIPMIEKVKYQGQIQEIQLTKVRSGERIDHLDFVAVESPLQISIKGVATSITMRTPGDDIALALGFLFTEGIFGDYNAIADALVVDENSVNIIPEEGHHFDVISLERNFYSTSSCGVCGKSSVEAIKAQSKYIPPVKDIKVESVILTGLQDKLLSVQSAFEVTGGLHACALFSPEGRYLYHSEDVGRHNALDKLIGHALMAGRIPLDEHILLLSGRASFELVQKASMAGIQVIAAVGAPSSLAVDLATTNNITLVGFLKKTGFNIYSGKHRIE